MVFSPFLFHRQQKQHFDLLQTKIKKEKTKQEIKKADKEDSLNQGHR